MLHQSSARAMAEAIVHASNYREAHQEARGPADEPGLTIAFSRQAGAGGTAIASEVGSRLGWPVYDNALVEHIAQEMHLRKQLLESVDERRTHWIVDCAEAFSLQRHVRPGSYVRHLLQTLLSLSAHGSCVIVGRGASHVLPPATTLRVRVVGTRDDRVAGLAREMGISRDEANRRLDELDRERVAFVMDHFRRDPRDPEEFDLVVNSSRYSHSECAQLILDALHLMEARVGAHPSLAAH